MVTPERITIDIPQAELDDLRARLRNTRWPADPGNPGGRYGATREWMEDLVGYWADTFDWRAVEAEMNGYEQYRVVIDDVPDPLHAGARQGPEPDADRGDPRLAVDLLGPAPAGRPAGRSGRARRRPRRQLRGDRAVAARLRPVGAAAAPPASTCVRVAALWKTLMTDVLGFSRFGAEGGDWGAIVTARLGHAYPEQLIGVYLTLPVIPGLVGYREPTPDQYAPDEQWMVERIKEARPLIEAHVAVHRRDPQTFAYAMADSPAGLGAWLWHRRDLWCDGDALEVFGRDFLCTLSSLYWFNTSFASSIRLYAEQFGKKPVLEHDRERIIEVPTGFAIFPKELMFLPRAVAERHTDLRAWNVHDKGGHFAPAEQPDAVVDDLRAFFRPLR